MRLPILGSCFLILAAVMADAIAQSGIISLPIPQENWSLTFEAPALKEMPLPFKPRGYAYLANAGRLNVSLYVEAPSCPGSDQNAGRLKCFLETRRRIPYFIPTSLRVSETSLGVLVVYGMRVETEGRSVTSLHSHVLFHRDGKEVDFHASIVQPDANDAQSLRLLVQSVTVVEK